MSGKRTETGLTQQESQAENFPGTAPTSSAEERTQAHSKFFTGLRNGLFEPKHERRMGKAVFLFGWLVGRQTTQNGSTGLILGGKVLTWQWLASESGWPERTLQRWGQILRSQGYIQIDREQHGFTVQIRNAKKSLHWQRGLFSDPPELARLATSGDTESGESRGKSGDSGVPILLMNPRVKAKGGTPHSLHDEIRKWCAREWEKRFDRKPPWDGRDSKALKELLEARPDLILAEIQQVWANYMASTKSYYDEKGWPLWVFCKDFAGLSLHPIHDRGGDHGTRTATKTSGRGDADPRLARFRQVGRKASDFAQHAH